LGNLLVSSCFKGKINGKAIGDYQIGEHKNPPYPFNVAPTSLQSKIIPEIIDYGEKCA
jgi:hypothetical protein